MSCTTTNTTTSYTPRLPTYFLSIGGPNTIFDKSLPAFTRLGTTGQEITKQVRPKAVVVISAHWQADASNTIQINAAEDAGIIYDFYGFPKEYYEVEYPNRGNREVAEKVAGRLEKIGVRVEMVNRGLDHGVWAGFLAAFNPQTNPLGVPIVQVSLFNSDDPIQHYRMGEALADLRSEGILIIGAGMSVHNLHDFRAARAAGNAAGAKLQSYTVSFDEALRDAATALPAERQAHMTGLMRRSDTRKAHPSLEHLLPIYVAAGAAGEDVGQQLWTRPDGSLSWAQYRFGKIPRTD